MMKRFAIALSLVVIGIQFVPVSRDNPPVLEGIAVPPGVREILRTSCYDCHSNETRWPWYGYIAPMSWGVARDVQGARDRFNFSEWGKMDSGAQAHLLSRMRVEIEKGRMPLARYVALHSSARLTETERATLLAWIESHSDH